MFKLSPNSLLAILVQALLAVGYTVLVNKLFFLLVWLFGNDNWPQHLINILLATLISLIILFAVNFVFLRLAFLRLGIFISIAAFIYFYVHNIHEHVVPLLIGLRQSPLYLINLLLLVATPFLIGRFLQQHCTEKSCLTDHSSRTPNGAP